MFNKNFDLTMNALYVILLPNKHKNVQNNFKEVCNALFEKHIVKQKHTKSLLVN